MAKYLNLAAFIDGTWNGCDSKTNVWRMRESVVRKTCYTLDDGDDGYLTYANYERGPGTSPDTKWTGGAFAVDLGKAIGYSYDWIATKIANRPATSDREVQLYLFGFSRGAYSVHVLSWLLNDVGVPRHVNFAKDIVDAYVKHDDEKVKELRERAECRPSPPIKLLGLWDVVSAPLDVCADYHDEERAPIVEKICHAMAVEERRRNFNVMHYHPEPSVVVQTWFPGVHGDLGGTYGDDRTLADIALNWMQCRAREAGLGIKPRPVEMTSFDFSGLREHNEAWSDTANRIFAAGDLLHPSLVSRTKIDPKYTIDLSGYSETTERMLA